MQIATPVPVGGKVLALPLTWDFEFVTALVVLVCAMLSAAAVESITRVTARIALCIQPSPAKCHEYHR